jgi:hypothetical protein
MWGNKGSQPHSQILFPAATCRNCNLGMGFDSRWYTCNTCTSNQKSPRRIDEGAAAGDGHQTAQHPVGNLVGIERLVSLVDLHQGGDDCLRQTSRGTHQAHGEGDATHGCVDDLAWRRMNYKYLKLHWRYASL